MVNIIESILENKRTNTIALYPNFFDNTPSWQDFIDYIEESSSIQTDLIDHISEYDLSIGVKVIGNVLIKGGFYFYTPQHRHIGESEKIVDIFKTLNPRFNIQNLYVNLSSNIDNVAIHHDEADNFYWQCQGSVDWVSGDKTFRVNKGDLVFIPSGVKHGVNFFEPRAAVGFSTHISPEKLAIIST